MSQVDFLDYETLRRRSIQRKIISLAVLLGILISAYPLAQSYKPRWYCLKAARKLTEVLTQFKTQAMIQKKTMEFRFVEPDKLEMYEVSSCGVGAQRNLVSEIKLSSLANDNPIEFVKEEAIRKHGTTTERVLKRLCYDPLYGSSLMNDGLAHASIFLAHRTSAELGNFDHVVQLFVQGPSADLSFE